VIGGVGQVVEIDESKFSRRKHNSGHGKWIFGGVQRDTGACFLIPTRRKRDKDTLLTAINDWIFPGTTIISDCWNVEL